VKEKGEDNDVTGVRTPVPFSDNVTLVAVPPNMFPSTVIGVVPQVIPVTLDSESVGHCPFPSKEINKIKLTKRRTLVISSVNL
jgi:hypothetical protein